MFIDHVSENTVLGALASTSSTATITPKGKSLIG